MINEGLLAEWRTVRLRLFKWRYELSFIHTLMLCFGLSCLTGLAAQLRVPLPFTPVPITGQVFAVLLAGVLLGARFGALSQLLYVGLGTAGIPWFSNWSWGLAVLAGPTGGYLVGFIGAAALIGYFTDRSIICRRIWVQAPLMMAGVGVIYLFGAIHFSLVMHTGLRATLSMAVLPFVLVDLVKAVLAALWSWVLLPKAPYGDEIDKAGSPN